MPKKKINYQKSDRCPYYRFCRRIFWFYLFIPLALLLIFIMASTFFIHYKNKTWHDQSNKFVAAIDSIILKVDKGVRTQKEDAREKDRILESYHNQVQEAYERQFTDLLVVLTTLVALIAIVIPLISHYINRSEQQFFQEQFKEHEKKLEEFDQKSEEHDKVHDRKLEELDRKSEEFDRKSEEHDRRLEEQIKKHEKRFEKRLEVIEKKIK